MFKRKENEEVKREPKIVKLLFSEIPVGSVFFNDDYRGYLYPIRYRYRYPIIKQLKDFEQPKHTITRYLPFSGNPYDNTKSESFEVKILYCNFVTYENITEYGFDYCVENNLYSILDLDYIRKIKEFREKKTVKEIKEFIEKEVL